MPSQLPNPYEKFDAHRSEVRVGHGAAWWLTFVFLLLCLLPPFWRNANQFLQGENGWTPVIELFRYAPGGDKTLRDHLREAEGQIENAEFTEAPRQWMQGLMTTTLREGNRKTAIGDEGWLYFRPAIDAVTGYGPLKAEPDTVAKDPNREPWNGPLDTILQFNRQLEEFGAELILMPIPVKPMIRPEHLTGKPSENPISHPDAERFYASLREQGVEVLDLSDEWFAAAKEGDQVFLKQDTHWTPEMMQATAKRVSSFLKNQAWFDEGWVDADRFAAGEVTEVSAPGDLLDNLELPGTLNPFSKESAAIVPVKEGAELISIYDQKSPIVLLGDSFTNIFHQKDMKWGEGAGFAEHLSLELGVGLDTIAQNGQASTGVRENLANRPGAVILMKEKKAVIWAIAARDLFLSETPARAAGVKWKEVEFKDTPLPQPGEAGPVRLRAKLTFKSPFLDPATAPYEASVYAAEYEVEEVLEGTYEADTALVFHWAFRNRKLEPTASFEEGDVRELALVPMSEKSELQGINQANDSMRFELVPYWADAVVSKTGLSEDAIERASRIASIATAAFSLLFGGVILGIYRRKRSLRASTAEAAN